MASAATHKQEQDMEDRPVLGELVNMVKYGTELNVAAQTGDLLPVVVAYNSHHNELHMVQLASEGSSELAHAIRAFLAQKEASSYALVIEGWATTFYEAAEAHNFEVSEMPADDRYEMVQILAVERDGIKLSYEARIHRTDDGRELGEWKQLTSYEGRFVITEW